MKDVNERDREKKLRRNRVGGAHTTCTSGLVNYGTIQASCTSSLLRMFCCSGSKTKKGDNSMKRFPVVLLLFVVSGLVVAFSACQAPSSVTSSSNQATSNDRSYAPLNVNLYVDRYEFTTPASMCAALLTAEVQGVTHGKSFWNTPDGLRPPLPATAHASLEQTIIQEGYRIYKSVQFGTIKVLRDQRHQQSQLFVTVGGQVQQDQYQVYGFPQLQGSGPYVIVFAPGSQLHRKGKVETRLEVYDAFPVDAQGVVTLQQSGSASEPGSGQPQSVVRISLTELQRQLSSCK